MYRYGCSIDCGGTPLRVYQRTLGSEDPWMNMEDYLHLGRALGYGNRWQIHYDAGALLMAGTEPESQHMAYQDAYGNPVIEEWVPCVLQEAEPSSTMPCPSLLNDVCPNYSMRIYGILPCAGEAGICGSSSSGGGPDTDWCARNRQSPSAVNCQDCCDQKVIERIKNLPKDQCKALKECIQEKCRNTDPETCIARSFYPFRR